MEPIQKLLEHFEKKACERGESGIFQAQVRFKDGLQIAGAIKLGPVENVWELLTVGDDNRTREAKKTGVAIFFTADQISWVATDFQLSPLAL